jgi:hypothetical protein
MREEAHMAIETYCSSMDKILAAWGKNIEALLLVAVQLHGKAPLDDARQIKNLQEVLQGLGKARELLKQECVL